MTEQHRSEETHDLAATELMTLTEVAALVRVPPATLRYWRHLDIGPQSFKIGRHVRYERQLVIRWLREQQLGGRGPNAA